MSGGDGGEKLAKALKRGRQARKEDEEKQEAMRNRVVVLDTSTVNPEVARKHVSHLTSSSSSSSSSQNSNTSTTSSSTTSGEEEKPDVKVRAVGRRPDEPRHERHNRKHDEKIRQIGEEPGPAALYIFSSGADDCNRLVGF